MSEKRRPDAVLTLQVGEERFRYEVFHAAQFAGEASRSEFYHAEQPSLMLTPADMSASHFVRVRVNGVWAPRGRRAMYPVARAMAAVTQDFVQRLIDDAQAKGGL